MMNERQILEMLSYLKAIDEKLEAIGGMFHRSLRKHYVWDGEILRPLEKHPDILDLPDRRVGVPESGA
jgi:hypothetical protein